MGHNKPGIVGVWATDTGQMLETSVVLYQELATIHTTGQTTAEFQMAFSNFGAPTLVLTQSTFT